jgi:hypothetical protein
MKHFLNISLVTLFAAALMQSYRANMELKYNYEALAWQMNNKTEQLNAILAANSQRTHREAQKAAKSETQMKALPTGAGQVTSRQ